MSPISIRRFSKTLRLMLLVVILAVTFALPASAGGPSRGGTSVESSATHSHHTRGDLRHPHGVRIGTHPINHKAHPVPHVLGTRSARPE